ncbi:hypothetical protein FJT64_025804 [Amphibalanus amphitrite]|uniref:Uncharacterized protein n=1 Tax=Amphibalanus amphitrite TaxID=1232801 RepID=A0A6A4WJJ0_AMPAM|nr:hypothetical protein FJT64_025804 [Amphibalanus amphitrite]
MCRYTVRLPYRTEEEDPKSCCGLVVTQSVSIRWFIVMIAFVGLCCAIVGTVLGALKATGREHLTVSLLMIGVGIVLITVSGIAWRLTSRDSPSCRMMLGLSRQQEEPESRRFMHRVVPAYGRPHHPYAAMVYPEFQFRPPPPSYHASMQAYRLGLLLDRHNAASAAGNGAVLSPPPSYRPGTGTLRPGMNTLSGHSEYSHPPSYHSRQSSANPQPQQEPAGVCHSRNPSVLSFLSHESLTDGGHVTEDTAPPLDDTVGQVTGEQCHVTRS